ncbi:MAG: hypothetical protein JNL43_03475, partial [Flavobacteriales bacterium]|nr:hypothetical protein [Flavobacteriales bacterium]
MAGLILPCSLLAQGFNARYDAFDWAFPQGGYGIELSPTGYVAFSSSDDCDSISPLTCFGHASVLLTELDQDGSLLWQKRSWRPNHSAFAGWANCCDTIPGGGFIVGGASEATDGSDEIYLMRFDANGDTLWTKVFGDPTLNRYWIGRQVKRTLEGGFVVIGITDQQGSRDGFALKTDALGTEEWRRIYGWSNTNVDGLVSVDLAADGDLFMGGIRLITETNNEMWV